VGTTGSTHAHELATNGFYFTEFARPVHALADFVTALRQRQGRPRHRPGAPLVSGPI
jgi:hypothetical protein